MISFNDLTRFLQPIKRKIFLLIGRAILMAVNPLGKTMKIQVVGLNGETITDVEWIKNYGFDSYPIPSLTAEAVIGFVNGNRDQGIALAVGDRELRPTLAIGEVSMYHGLGTTSVKLKATDVEISAGVTTITLKPVGADINGGGLLEYAALPSNMKIAIDTKILIPYNAHTHTCAAPGNPSSPPLVAVIPPLAAEYSSTTVKIT